MCAAPSPAPAPSPADPDAFRQALKAQARALGFTTCAVARAILPDEKRRDLAGYLAEGRHGAMGWMAETEARRGDPRAMWPDAVTVIALGLSYAPKGDPRILLGHPDRGAISTYARNRDYHDVAKGRAKMLAQWLVSRADSPSSGGRPEVKVFVDTAPVMEKPLAQAAGLGWQGKHTNLVSRSEGSWLFLAEILTTLALPPDSPESDHCGSCRRCLDSCPTGALPAPYRIDARRCVSYLTIEHPGPIPRALRPLMGNRIYGCDDCLAVCPWNRFARPTAEPAFLPRAELTAPRLADLSALDDADFRMVFSGSPIKRIRRSRFVRNVLIALGNSGDTALAPAAEARLTDPDPLVRGAAVWAYGRLAGAAALAARRDALLPAETDPEVRAEWLADRHSPEPPSWPEPPR